MALIFKNSKWKSKLCISENLIQMSVKFNFHTCHLTPPRCDQMINAVLRQVRAQPMTPWHIASPTTHLSITSAMRFCQHLQDRSTFPTCFYFSWKRGEPGVEAALGWRCANGERVHSPTHPFLVLSRSIIVERWWWEPQSLPTKTPAAPPSAAAKQPPASPVISSIHSSILPSSYKKEQSSVLQRSCCLF